MNKKNTYQIVEDDGGSLYLFVFSPAGDVIGGIDSLEYADAGEYWLVRDGLNSDPLREIGGWDGHMDDPQAVYAELVGWEYGWQVICDNGTLYPDCMGRAAEAYCGLIYYLSDNPDHHGIAGRYEALAEARVQQAHIEETFPCVTVELVDETFSASHRNDSSMGIVADIDQYLIDHTGDANWYDEVLTLMAGWYKNRDGGEQWDDAEVEQLRTYGKI